MTKPTPSKSIFSRNKNSRVLRRPSSQKDGRKKVKIPASIFVEKPLYGKQSTSSKPSATHHTKARSKKTPALSETERDNLIRTFIKDREHWGRNDNEDENLSENQSLERIKGGLFKNMSDVDLLAWVDEGKRRKALVRYVFIHCTEEELRRPDYRAYQLDEADRLNATKFKRYPTEKLVGHVTKLNEKFMAGKLGKRARKPSKTKHRNPLIQRLKSSLTAKLKSSSKATPRPGSNEAPLPVSQAARKPTRTERLMEIYEDLYQQPRDDFMQH